MPETKCIQESCKALDAATSPLVRINSSLTAASVESRADELHKPLALLRLHKIYLNLSKFIYLFELLGEGEPFKQTIRHCHSIQETAMVAKSSAVTKGWGFT